MKRALAPLEELQHPAEGCSRIVEIGGRGIFLSRAFDSLDVLAKRNEFLFNVVRR